MNTEDFEIESLIVADLTGIISEEEKAVLKRLLMESEHARELYRYYENVYNSEGAVNGRAQLSNNISLSDITGETPKGTRRPIRRLIFLSSAAAALICVISVAIVLNQRKETSQIGHKVDSNSIQLALSNGEIINLDNVDTLTKSELVLKNQGNTLTYTINNTDINPGFSTLTVPAGKSYNIILSDGTRLKLNSLTQLSFPLSFTGTKREITVSGEAYIEVAQKMDKPFIVHLPNSSVQVLGTSFNVNTYNQAERISLVTGRIKTVTEKDSLVLTPGTETIHVPGKFMRTEKFDEQEVLSWLKGKYYFEYTSLEEVSKIVSRWYGVEVNVAPDIRKKEFYGVMDRNQPISEFLNTLKETNEVNYSIDNNKIYLRK
ncbi:FecR family protein [Filimonas effusa]|uniref:FecR family protein n=1 Tax=Filimonas effusa TaxID=2508721 RepID=A0A4Q1D1F8_9BACT|nr:FecR domain-containing protein [Filimonas effusa]RXK81686.1 FecR family protein [Filimonas effusa]